MAPLVASCFYSKEIFFCLLILLQSAKVNDAADLLLREISQSKKWSVCALEQERRAVYIAESGAPIACRFFGQRMSRKHILTNAQGLLIAVTIGLSREVISRL